LRRLFGFLLEGSSAGFGSGDASGTFDGGSEFIRKFLPKIIEDPPEMTESRPPNRA